MFFPDKILFTFVELKNGILESEKFRYFYKKRRLKLDPEEKKTILDCRIQRAN